MSTYREIKALTRELGGSRVGQRREAGQKLIQMLSLPEVRSRLVLEASPLGGTRGAVQRRTALAEMWRFIIQNAVVAVQTIARGNSKKLNASDIHMPYKLLQCSELPYETNMLYEPPKLSRKVAKLVFTYCYDMLQDEHALGLAEEQLLQMMAYLCHRTEYVAYMRPHMEIYELVQEIEHRITVVDDGDPQIMIQAGQIWENLIITATRELGMGLHLLLPGCVKIVAVWCHNHLQKQKQCREFPHILRGLAVLLESDLEQAVAPLTRYGRQILSLAKRGYATRDKLHRQACNEYFMAHL